METIKVVASVTPLWRQRSKTISPPPGPVRDRRGFLAVAGREGDFPPSRPPQEVSVLRLGCLPFETLVLRWCWRGGRREGGWEVTGGAPPLGSPDEIFLFFSTEVRGRSGAKLPLPLPRAAEILSDFMAMVGSPRGHPIFAREAKTTLDITLQN